MRLSAETPPETVNFEGFPAWEKSVGERFHQLMLSGGIANAFYMNQGMMIRHTLKTVKQFIAQNPYQAAQFAIEGRQVGFMRACPIIALSYLSACEDKVPFKQAFDQIILTPRDLTDFIDITFTHLADLS